ncbi:unnamed protein product [Leuciscus chuanchicus]
MVATTEAPSLTPSRLNNLEPPNLYLKTPSYRVLPAFPNQTPSSACRRCYGPLPILCSALMTIAPVVTQETVLSCGRIPMELCGKRCKPRPEAQWLMLTSVERPPPNPGV